MVEPERYEPRDLRSPQLVPYEGWRVEVVDVYGETRRFIVGKSMGPWVISLELKRRNSTGGGAADIKYAAVTPIERVF